MLRLERQIQTSVVFPDGEFGSINQSAVLQAAANLNQSAELAVLKVIVSLFQVTGFLQVIRSRFHSVKSAHLGGPQGRHGMSIQYDQSTDESVKTMLTGG